MTRLASRTARLRKIEEILLLSSKGVRVSDLAQKLQVDRRTIYRDIDFLSGEGVPIWSDGGSFGINRTSYQATVRLTYHELVALVLAGLILARSMNDRNPHVVNALRGMAVTLPEPFTGQLERAAARVEKNRTNHRVIRVLENIAEGWGTKHKVGITYKSPKGTKTSSRVLHPYLLEPTQSGIYVIGFDEKAGDLRTYKIERLKTARVLPDTYEILETFNPETYFENSWGIMTGEKVEEVVLRFAPDASPYVRERYWHPSQRFEPTEDGGCMLWLTITQPREMLPWIRSWGAQVEVLGPVWLKKRVADEWQKAAALYAAKT